MIINIRGTSGSGKTTLVRRLLNDADSPPDFNVEEIYEEAAGKERLVAYRLPFNLYVLGSYKNTCGGCDTFSWKGGTGDYLEDLVRRYAAKGHVIFEGYIVSNSYGRWAKVAEELPFTWAFLHTPVEDCIARVYGRRAAKGRGDKPFKEQNLRNGWEGNKRSEELATAAGFNIVQLMPETAYEQLRGLLGIYVSDAYSIGPDEVLVEDSKQQQSQLAS